MRFEIARERLDPPVRVLPLLALPKLGELQGRNGIGKSLSIKLIELVTGHQPWLGDRAAWQTLCASLGPTSITASGLAGGQSIEWDLAPQAWPDDPPADIAELCEEADGAAGLEIRIDGVTADLSAVQALIRVHRLVGEETLEDSVAARIRYMVARSDRERQAIARASKAVRDVLAEAIAILEPLSGRRVRGLSERLSELTVEQKTLVKQQDQDGKRVSRLLELEQRHRALTRLEELHSTGADQELDEKLKAIETKLKDLRQERDQRFEAAVADVQLRQRIQDVRADIERVEGLLERAGRDARTKAAEAGLDGGESGDLDSEYVANAHDAAAEEIRRLRETQASQDAIPLVRGAANSVRRTLSKVEPPAVLDRPFVALEDRQITGRELIDGLDKELAHLDSIKRHPSAEQLDRDLAAATTKLDAITELQRAMARQRRHSTALENRRTELLQFTEQAGGEANDSYVEIEKSIGQCEDERRDLLGSRFRYSILEEEIGAPEDLPQNSERLMRDLRAAGVVVADDLVETRVSVEAALRESEFQLRQKEQFADEVRRDLASAKERSGSGVEAFEHTALARALSARGLTLKANDIEATAEQWLRACEHVTDSLNRLDVEADAVVGAFDRLREDGGQIDRTRIEHVRSVAEQQIVDALNQPVLQEELFDHGVVVSYDHKRGVVAFRPEGSPVAVSRSLSAFSSGERVFAYTQMRLRAIPDGAQPCENRLVALDEFGAFLESRRIAALEDLVRDELLGHGIDAVLFILPLTSNVTVNEHGFALVDRS